MNRVLVIGLDGMTFDVLRPRVVRGNMPYLGKLIEEGVTSPLTSTIPPMTAPAWSTFMTGKNPGRHGVFHFVRSEAGSYQYSPQDGHLVSSASIDGKPLWEILSERGRRVGVINVPLTYPIRSVNGFVIAGMMTPPSATDTVYPPGLSGVTTDYKIDLDYVEDRDEARIEADLRLVAQAQALLEQRAALTMRLMEEQEWDFLMVVFVTPDRLLHFLWEYMVDIPETSQSRDPKIQIAIDKYLKGLDEVVERLVTPVEQDTNVIVMSDHGFGPAPDRIFYVNEWLAAKGYLCPERRVKRTNLTNAQYWAMVLGLRKGALGAWLRRLVPRQVVQHIRKRRSLPIDWEHTRAYCVESMAWVCGVKINLKGREPNGIVEPGAEYKALRDCLLNKLRAVRDPDRDCLLVKAAYRREEVYSGPYTDIAPDLILLLNPDYAGYAPLGAGTYIGDMPPNPRTGEHRLDGIVILRGPDIQRGGVIQTPHIADLAPTILYLMGEPVPSDMDGRVWQEVVTASFLEMCPIRRCDIEIASEADFASIDDEMSEADREQVMERLKALGYLG